MVTATQPVTSSTDRIGCRQCGNTLLSKTYDGKWMSKHHDRAVKFSGSAIIEIECARGHSTTLVIDGMNVRRLE